ncbi:hypothetical protein A244_33476, partial [Pseudomonas syringae pv. actinidiae ICMP 18807]
CAMRSRMKVRIALRRGDNVLMEYICTPFGVLWLARLVGLERRNYELRGRRTEGITFKYTHCVTQRFCDVVYGSSHLFAPRR